MVAVREEPRGPVILVVEDDQPTREILCRMIGMKFPRAAIHVATTGEEGMELFRAFEPSIVITDINLPITDGISMGAEMKSVRSETVLIMLSGYDIATVAERLRSIGVDDYIVKPIEFQKLFDAISLRTGQHGKRG